MADKAVTVEEFSEIISEIGKRPKVKVTFLNITACIKAIEIL